VAFSCLPSLTACYFFNWAILRFVSASFLLASNIRFFYSLIYYFFVDFILVTFVYIFYVEFVKDLFPVFIVNFYTFVAFKIFIVLFSIALRVLFY
jgi:hypothetical protein